MELGGAGKDIPRRFRKGGGAVGPATGDGSWIPNRVALEAWRAPTVAVKTG